MNAFISYVRGSLTELNQVRWPTQQQAIRLTTIVVIFIAVTAVFFGIIDSVLSKIISITLTA